MIESNRSMSQPGKIQLTETSNNINKVHDESQIQNENTADSQRSGIEVPQPSSISTLIVFCFAILLHTILEGLAIGVFKEIGEMAVLGASVVVHKIPVAYTVGTTFLTKNRPFCHWFTITFFILFVTSTPIGIIIGASVNDSGGGLANVIIQSIAGGTFVYLAACDFIIDEFHTSEDILESDNRLETEKNKTQRCISFIKFSMVGLGFAIVVTIFSVGAKHEH